MYLVIELKKNKQLHNSADRSPSARQNNWTWPSPVLKRRQLGMWRIWRVVAVVHVGGACWQAILSCGRV